MSVIKIDGNFDLGNMTDPSLAISCVNNVQSSVKSFLPGFGNGWQLWGGQQNILRVVL